MALEWIPEKFPPSGGLSAKGFSKLLGRPSLDPLAVLIRETAQNSWDARQDDVRAVQFDVQGRDLSMSEIEGLKEVFTNARKISGSDLSKVISGKKVQGLIISDRGTKGLGGPLLANETSGDDVYDWVNFILNVGKEKTAHYTGGTYGFGKTISYLVSRVSAIVVHSHTSYKGKSETRLIASAIGSEFNIGGKICTGRHWWGVSKDGNPLPLTGRAADRLADQIGMPRFETGQLGTNIMIVAPDFDGRSTEQAMTYFAESITWHLWPKMVANHRDTPMTFSVSWNDRVTPVPSPSERPPLNGFVQALSTILDGPEMVALGFGTTYHEIKCLKPNTVVGDLAIVQLVEQGHAEVDDGGNTGSDDSPLAAAMITGPAHHIALLRTPELVVQYLEGPIAPEGGIEWTGVFRCRDEHDHKFAQAEPPTHDSWMPNLISNSRDKTIVNVGLRRIKQVLDGLWTTPEDPTNRDVFSTASIANDLAELIRTLKGAGPGQPEGPGGGGGGGQRKARIEITGSGPVVHDDGVATKVTFKLTPLPGSRSSLLRMTCGAALDRTTISFDLDPELQFVEARWAGRTTHLEGHEQRLEIEGDQPTDVDVLIARGPESSVLLDVEIEEIGGR